MNQGAPWPGAEPPKQWKYDEKDLWAFRPVQKAATSIDEIIDRRLRERGLKPAPMASRRDLIRRVTYDLTGLPPTLEQIQAFETDKHPNAYANLVERLLASRTTVKNGAAIGSTSPATAIRTVSPMTMNVRTPGAIATM